eukprot:m.146358 g.146358  ORF g.146358 m.146358 type:complete len:581 (+) comp14140_c0_seq3:403-2145(+)
MATVSSALPTPGSIGRGADLPPPRQDPSARSQHTQHTHDLGHICVNMVSSVTGVTAGVAAWSALSASWLQTRLRDGLGLRHRGEGFKLRPSHRVVITGGFAGTLYWATFKVAASVVNAMSPHPKPIDLPRAGEIAREVMDKAVPEKHRRVFAHIEANLDRMDRDLGFLTPFKHPVVVNMAMLRDLTATLPDKGVPTTGDVVGEAEAAQVAATGLHWMRFATATAYGGALMMALGVLEPSELAAAGVTVSDVADLDRVNRTAFEVHTGVLQRDVLVHLKSPSVESGPGHLVLVDHAQKAVVFAIRGTACFDDALTDLLADTVPFLFGTVGHRGIVDAAHFALATQGSTVRQALERHPGYKLVVTGQSLGGGIALVLSMLIGQTHPDLLPTLECHAFAPPPVISLTNEIPDEIWDALTVYVHGRDCVPRLSIRSFSVLDACVRAVDEQPLTLPDRAGQLAGDAVQLPREVLTPTMPPAFEDEAHYPALVIPGRRIYHLIACEDEEQGQSERATRYRIERSRWECFQPLNIVGSEMISDHLPHMYELAFNAVLSQAESSSCSGHLSTVASSNGGVVQMHGHSN